MADFKYELRDAAGQMASGVLQATSLADANNMLRGQGYITSLTPVAGQDQNLLQRMQNVSVEFGPGLKDVFAFTNQLAVMIKAGINIRSAMEGIAEQVENVKFKKIIEEIKDDVESGKSFSDALAKHPKIFSPLYINMVRASELSGNFAHMLERIANYLTQQIETRSMVRGAMIYPAIIAFMAVGTTIFLLTFVLPRFTALFAGKEHLLPKPTLALIAVSDFLRNFWYVVIAGLVVAVYGGYQFVHTTVGREYWHKLLLRMPLLKRMFRALYITRGLHTMGELVTAGVPMLETLRITADISGNVIYERMWLAVHDAVKEGNKINQPLMEHALLPTNVVQMIAAGEESGKLGEVLRDISEYYSKDLKSTIKSVTSMIEPLMIMLMGVVVGFIAMSIILPIFKMSSLVK